MKRCSTCKLGKDIGGFYRNRASLDGLCNTCKDCDRARKKSNETDKLSRIIRDRKNRDRLNAYHRKYAKENRDKYQKYAKTYADKNRERIRELNRKSYNSEKQRPKNNARAALRRALKVSATLPGFKKELEAKYQGCPKGFHVDHIIPLKGVNVCGLHVPWNLQYLSAEENVKKGNKTIL